MPTNPAMRTAKRIPKREKEFPIRFLREAVANSIFYLNTNIKGRLDF